MSRTARSFETYIERFVDAELDVLFGDLAAVLLDGPKGSARQSPLRGERNDPPSWCLQIHLSG